MKAANILPKDVQKHTANGSNPEPDPVGDLRGEAYQNFVTTGNTGNISYYLAVGGITPPLVMQLCWFCNWGYVHSEKFQWQ